jgi:hypothetical protein
MDIQKTITEAMANEERALWFIKKLIHDEVRKHIKSNPICISCGSGIDKFTKSNREVTRPFVYGSKVYSQQEYEILADNFSYTETRINLIENALMPKEREPGWVDDYDSLLGMVNEALELISEWKREVGA